MAKRKKPGRGKPADPPRDEEASAAEANETTGTAEETGSESGGESTGDASGTDASGTDATGTGKPTLEELTISRRTALEERLAEELDMLDDAIEEMKTARAEFKATKETVADYRNAIYQTNQMLREVLRGKWRPEKPDPQKRLGFPPEPGDSPEAASEAQHDPRPEASSLWKSKPVAELGLAKSLVRKLEDEGFPTLGVIANEFEVMGSEAFSVLELSDKQIEKLRVSVAKFRPKEPEAEGGAETPAATAESEATPVEVDAQEGAEVERQEDSDQEASGSQEDEGSEE